MDSKENLVITPKPWSFYSFVGIDQSINVLEEWMELKNHRKNFLKRADPFIQEIFSYETYTSTAQREAILHMMFMKLIQKVKHQLRKYLIII